jgi:poly(beta-D-mannuronate) lyase
MQILIKQIVILSLFILSTSYSWAINSPFDYEGGKTSGYLELLIASPVCSLDLKSPYTNDLMIESKYDQSDSTKSTLSTADNTSSKQKSDYINSFIRDILKYSEYAIRSTNKKKSSQALRCLVEGLDSWALASSLLNVEASKTGVATRKWFLAAISTTLMKLEAKYSDFRLNSSTKSWLNKLALKVVSDYNPRLIKQTRYFNNHDLWAAWAVMSWAILNNDQSMFNWAKKVFDFAMTRTEFHNNNQFSVFPIEIARGKLALSYSNYALVPVMFLADTFKHNNINISQYHQTLRALANFSGLGVVQPSSVSNLVSVKQEQPALGKFIWLLPYTRMFGKDELVTTMTNKGIKPIQYTQMGGTLNMFYSAEVNLGYK